MSHSLTNSYAGNLGLFLSFFRAFQVSQGLIGAFVVLPNDELLSYNMIPDRDFTLLVQSWEIPQPELGKVCSGFYKPVKFDRNPNFFTLNGKSFPDTSPLLVKHNEKIRIRFISKSSTSHSMHIHGHDFSIPSIDGFNRDNLWDDTINLASGKRIDVEFLANNSGIWPINGTKTFHQSNNGATPGGMVTRLIYS